MQREEKALMYGGLIVGARVENSRNFFDHVADRPQWATLTAEEQQLIQLAIREMPIIPGSRVIEPGCGAGRVTRLLANAAGERGLVFSFDVSHRMIQRAKNSGSHSRTTYAHASVLDIPLRANSADAALCFNCFHHFACPPTALQELARVLRRGGRLGIIHSEDFESFRFDELSETAEHLFQSAKVRRPHMLDLLEMLPVFGYRVLKVVASDSALLTLARRE